MGTVFQGCYLISPQNMQMPGSHISSRRMEVSGWLAYFMSKGTCLRSAFTDTAVSPECLCPYLGYIQMSLPLVQSSQKVASAAFVGRSKL